MLYPFDKWKNNVLDCVVETTTPYQAVQCKKIK